MEKKLYGCVAAQRVLYFVVLFFNANVRLGYAAN